VFVSGLRRGVVAIAAGGAHTCALTLVGAARCWGWNRHGQVGDGTTIDRLTPVIIPGFQSLVRARALLTTSSLSVGAHSLRASYPGDALHSPSSGARQQIVH
jgi:alpha-tubulin suppressor-like RCC1 family protein